MPLPSTNFFEAIKILQLGSRESGVSFAELEKHGLSRERVLWHLEIFPTIGLPPFYPDDILDVEIRGERIYLFSTLQVTTPLNISEIDLLALQLAIYWGIANGILESVEGSQLVTRLAECRPDSSVVLANDGSQIYFADEISGRELIDPIQGAITDRRVVLLNYFSMNQGEMTTRLIWPYRIYLRSAILYVRAYQPGTENQLEGWRSFRLDRVRDLDVLPSCFDPQSFSEPEEGERLFVFDPSDKIRTRTRFFSTSAKYVAEVSSAASISWTGKDQVDLDYEVRGFPYYRSFVLQFGHEAEVLEPKHFRTAISDHLEKILDSLGEL